MKKFIFTVICSIFLMSFFTFPVFSQNRKMNMVEFEKRKMEYIKKEAALSEDESSRYFPLNSEYSKRKFDLYRVHRENIKKMKQERGQEMSEEEYKKLLDNDMELKLKDAELDKEYAEKFEKTLSPEKLYRAQQAEKNFMQNEVMKFREGRGNNNRER